MESAACLQQEKKSAVILGTVFCDLRFGGGEEKGVVMKHTATLVSLQERATTLQQLASQTSKQRVRQRLLMLAASFASAQILPSECDPFHPVPGQPALKTARHKALRNGMSMRDLVADWKRWTFAERFLA